MGRRREAEPTDPPRRARAGWWRGRWQPVRWPKMDADIMQRRNILSADEVMRMKHAIYRYMNQSCLRLPVLALG
jgi:hypothetical protein